MLMMINWSSPSWLMLKTIVKRDHMKWTSVSGVIIFCADLTMNINLKKTRIESELHTNYSKILSQNTLLQKQEAGMNLVSDHEPYCNVTDHVPCCTMFNAALKEFLVQPRIFIHQLSVHNCYKHNKVCSLKTVLTKVDISIGHHMRQFCLETDFYTVQP